MTSTRLSSRARALQAGATGAPLGRFTPSAVALAIALQTSTALATPPTPGFPEPVVQWGVQKGETCESVATALYGSAKHAHLVLRYNRVACTRGAPLREGTTLVLPATVTDVPSARLDSVHPAVRSRPSGGAWSEAAPGQPLATNSNVSTAETGRAGIGFADRTRIILSENTLVVIYGTAAQSAVSKVRPPVVEVEEGEARAALASLRGPSADSEIVMGVSGGRVTASSRDAVVQKKGKRATVSVFDGTASVESAGRTVAVPKNFGSRFVERQPPSPPRPLPPAPVWEGVPEEVVLSMGGRGAIAASWGDVPRAQSYRVEVARDEAFTDIVVREEVPARIKRLSADSLPGGSYFVRVRAIDDEEYLGIATEVRRFRVVPISVTGGAARLDGGRIVADRSATLVFEAADGLDAGTAPDGLARAPSQLALSSLDGSSFWLRTAGGAPVRVEVVAPPKPEPPPPPPPPPIAPPPAPPPRVWVGPTIPMVSLGSRGDLIAAAPTARAAFAVSAAADGGPGDDARVAGRVFGSGALGPMSFDGLLATTSDPGATAWLGTRARVLSLSDSAFELAPLVRVGIPMGREAVTRLDAAVTLGGLAGDWTWLANAGARVRAGDEGTATPDAAMPYLLGVVTWDPIEWLRLFAGIDAQASIVDDGADDTRAGSFEPGGGAYLGLEVGAGPVFGSLAGRVSPLFEERVLGGEPLSTLQLSLGFRVPD